MSFRDPEHGPAAAEPPPDEAGGRTLLAIVLAAGKGTRMRSDRPKVLHRLAGRSMLAHVLLAARGAGATRIAVVAEPGHDDVTGEAAATAPGARVFGQAERLGTAHAVLAARAELARGADDVVVAFGDTPLITPATLGRLRAPLAAGAAVAVLAFESDDPTGYGRVLTEGGRPDGRVLAIREEKDASEAERAVRLCNAGLMALSGAHALALLERIRNDNAAGEYYLPDAVALAVADGLAVAAVPVAEAEAQGVNDRVQLSRVEAVIQARLRRAAMLGGATRVAPDTVFLSCDTRLERDVVVEPHCVFGPGVTVAAGCVVHAHSHLEGATLAAGAQVGPYARLRPGARIGAGARVGNFVEVKNATLGPGAKANHLAYLGDAEIGARANIGAGTITCNYDGISKHRTAIGAGAFIGSNTALVAPVTVGAGAYVASGSVITDAVPDGALALGRARQVVKSGRRPPSAVRGDAAAGSADVRAREPERAHMSDPADLLGPVEASVNPV